MAAWNVTRKTERLIIIMPIWLKIIVVGKDVIVSYETQNIPLDIGVIKNLVKQIIV